MKQYESYKPIKSSVYREAPITWNKYRVKDTVDKNTYYPVGDGDHGSIKPEMYQEEGIPYIRVQNLTWHGEILTDGIVCISEEVQLANKKSILYPGDILIAKTGATIGKLGLIPEHIKEANTTSSVGKLTVDKTRFNPKYILYCFQSRALQDQIWLEASQKSAQPGFNIDDLIVFEFLAPDLNDQSKIVEFLDRQTAIIDQLIQQKEKLIDLLKEKRQAVINEAVTKGLDPNAKMKDSGIEWLGEIPEHWTISRIKYLSSVISKGTTPSTEGKGLVDQGIRYLKAENIKDSEVSPEPEFYIDDETHEILKRSQLKENDILFVIAGATIGKVAILSKELTPANTNQAVSFIRLKENENHKFVHYWLTSSKIHSQIWLQAVQSAQPNLSMENLGNFPIPYPSSMDQTRIVNYLVEKTSELEKLIKSNFEVIEKLKEYRQSIISEAVTGKIDVRDWQANTKQVA
jgi:type I restriction enzyme S subunit